MPVRSQFLPLVFSWLHEMGADSVVDSIRRTFQLSEPRDALISELTVSLDAHRAITEMATHATRDDFFGIHVAEYCPRGHYGLVEHAARHAPDLGQALHRLTRYVPLLTETETLRLEIPALEIQATKGEIALVHSVTDEPLCLGRQANEFTLSILRRLMCQLASTAIQVRRVEFAHSPPPTLGELEREFGTTDLRFDMGHNALVFDQDIRGISTASSDRTLLPWLDRQAEMLLPAGPTRGSTLDLRSKIRAALIESRIPSLMKISSELGQNVRTLQRRLAAAGTSFQGELDTVRADLAESYLLDQARPICEIAFKLGYADLRGFVRAFNKWKGITPARFRRIALAGR